MAKQAPKEKQVIEEQESEQLSESYISIGLGLLVVVVVGILLYNYFIQRNKPTESTNEAENITQEATTSAKPGSTYIVVAGDTLWSISEKSYGTGYNWQKIADANNLTNSDQLVAGQEIKIPEIEVSPVAMASGAPAATPVATVAPSASPTPSPTIAASPTPAVTASPVASATPVATVAPSASPAIAAASPAPTTTAPSITGTSYTIARGDTLWSIAERAYGDPYQWTKIAQANKLENPNLIHADNVITLPR